MGKVCTKLTGREHIEEEIERAICQAAGVPYAIDTDEKREVAQADRLVEVALNGRRRSLLVGINYVGTENELHGCVNDVRRMLPVLEKHGFFQDERHQRILLDEEGSPAFSKPTRRNMLDSIEWLISGARAGDSLLFHYSGHGGREPASDTASGYHETLVPLDFQEAGMLKDKELFEELVKKLPAGVRLTCVLDSCHSAGVLDLPYRFVGAAADIQQALREDACNMVMAPCWQKDLEAWKEGNQLALLKDVGMLGVGLWNLYEKAKDSEGGDTAGYKVDEDTEQNVGTAMGQVVALTGCRSDQTSADVQDVSQQFHVKDAGGRHNKSAGFLYVDGAQRGLESAGGALTTALISVLQDADPSSELSFLDLLETIRQELASKGFSQVPQVAASGVIDLQERFALDTIYENR